MFHLGDVHRLAIRPAETEIARMLPSTSISRSTLPVGDSTATVPLPWRVMYRLPSTSQRMPSKPKSSNFFSSRLADRAPSGRCETPRRCAARSR